MLTKASVDSQLPVAWISSYEEAERHFSGASPAEKMSAEQQFNQLLGLENLDEQVKIQPDLIRNFEEFLSLALIDAFTENSRAELANRFLQRLLYRINRLNLFWYDALESYTNERSTYLAGVRDRIESAWQAWELTQLDIEKIRCLNVKQALQERADVDLNPPLTAAKRYLQEDLNLEGYRLLLAN
jgi:hypothetical protein